LNEKIREKFHVAELFEKDEKPWQKSR
jgi:hypothetical protein